MIDFKLGPLYVEFGGLLHKRFGAWVPDGLHIWLGSRGVHVFWARSKYGRRIEFDRSNRNGAESHDEALNSQGGKAA